MSRLSDVWNMRRSLSARILLLFTIGLLPIGLIAIQQTRHVVQEARVFAERDILARTVASVGEEAAIIQRAQGAALALGRSALALRDDRDECNALMQDFVAHSPAFVFAGFGDTDGLMSCLSTGNPVDVSGLGNWDDFVADPRPTITVNTRGAASGLPVLVTTMPVEDDAGRFGGFTSVSIPLALSQTLLALDIDDIDLALVDGDGRVLASSLGEDGLPEFERLGVRPVDVNVGRSGRVLSVEIGEPYPVDAAVVPLVPGSLYVVGTWAREVVPQALTPFGLAAPLFPILMWITGLAVAYLAVERLVLRHLRTLRQQITRLSMERGNQHYAVLPDAPIELVEIGNSFNAMIDRIAREHAEVQEASRQKSLLLREVHHRVKNNLQLIASILNMQLRDIHAPEAERVLRGVQDRVMSLAAIHKSLYVGTNVDRVRVDNLLTEIVSGLVNMGSAKEARLVLDLSLDPIELDADQVVPLSLLVTEAVTNALKHAGSSDGAPASVQVELAERPGGQVHLAVTNSKGDQKLSGDEAQKGTGLGSRLIAAFASQLGGEFWIDAGETEYALKVAFTKLEPEEDDASEPG